jgi:hypothetical protein
VQVVLQRRQRRRDEGLEERVRDAAERKDREGHLRPAVVSSFHPGSSSGSAVRYAASGTVSGTPAALARRGGISAAATAPRATTAPPTFTAVVVPCTNASALW